MLRGAVVALLLAGACAGAAPGARGGWCRAPETPAWTRAVAAHVVALSRRTPVVPLALAHDGRSFFASVWTPAFSGVARVDARTGRLTRIHRFPRPATDQAVGAFDGRWLVWAELRTFTLGGPFAVWAWDARTGATRRIGASGDWPNAWRGPDVRRGVAVWEQGTGPDGAGEVHAYDLARGLDRVLRRGHPQGPFLLDGGEVAWPESERPGEPTRMRTARTDGGASAPPPALAGLRGVSGLATDGSALAIPRGDFTSLAWAGSPRQTPRTVVDPGDPALHVENSVRVAGGRVFFALDLRDGSAGYLADAAAGRYVRVGSGTFALLDRSTLLLLDPGPKALHPRGLLHFVPLAALPPLPRCR